MSHIEKKEFEIYRITPPPPEWDLQEYIRQYIQTGDDNYFYWFLHYYEPSLNEKAKFFRNKYSMEEHFADIKQSFVTGLCKALLNYDISISPFLPYAQRYMEREAHNYIRTMRTGYSVQSEFEYARLKKAMAIYSELGGKFTEGTITKVSEQLGENYEKTKSIIEGGILTENYTDIQNKKDDEDDKESSIFVPDFSLNPENIYFKQELYAKLYEVYDGLEYTEKIMLAQHHGFCPDCLSTRYSDKTDLDENGKPKEKPIKPLPYTDIATDHGFSDADTAKRVCKRALDEIHLKLLYLLREQKDNDIIKLTKTTFN